MEIEAFATLVIPFIVIIYLGVVLMFLRPSRTTLIASLLGGLTLAVINMLFELLAYYAHWWHYTLNGLVLHLPIPFYITPFLIYGSLGYLFIQRFWQGRGHWFALLLLIGIPLLRAIADIEGTYTQSTYTTFDSILAVPMDFVMWLLAFYAGYWVFKRLSASEQFITLTQKVEG
ncbi:MAG: hypothetical protein ABI406_13235 [Ktedonobacteraceae bacterium]